MTSTWKIASFLLLFLFWMTPVLAQPSGLGVGVVLGEPTGLSAKVWTSDTQAFDAGAAWSLGRNAYLLLHADVLFHRDDLEGLQRGRQFFYFGFGGRIALANDPTVGARIPVGVTMLFRDAPMDAFFELAPVFDVIPSTRFGLNGGIGIRYYLGGSSTRR